MAAKKKETLKLEEFEFDIIDTAKTSQEAYDTLRERGYDNTGIGSFAAAARSWCEKGTTRRILWEGVEELVKERAG